MTPTRILVLHGFYDSAKNRQHQMRTLTRLMKDVQFVFVDSPFPFVDYGFLKSPETASVEQRYQWMSYRPQWTVADYPYDTIQESMQHICDYIHRHGPFDGLLGFSQGAIVCTAMLLNIPRWPSLPNSIRFVILVGCPAINEPTIVPILDTLNVEKHVPTLHIAGQTDTLVTADMSRAIFDRFNPTRAQFYLHKGGHYCPSDADFRRTLIDFIDRNTP